MKIKQISTWDNKEQKIFSINMDAEEVPIVKVKILRHAGDHREGNLDSYFIEVKAQVTEWQSPQDTVHTGPLQTGTTLFAMKTTMEHGMPLKATEHLAQRIEDKGLIDLRLWWHSN